MANRYTTERYVSGSGELQAALARMAAAAQTEVITAGVRAAIVPILGAQIALCPVRTDTSSPKGNKLKPGEMKESIRGKVVSYPADAKAVGLVGPTGRAKRVAHLVEFGHLATSSKKGQTIRRGTAQAAGNGTTHVPAHPFIRPSVRNTLTAQSEAFRAGMLVPYLAAVKST